MCLCVWLLSLIRMFSNFIHVEACISTLFLFMSEYYSTVWIYHILFIHLSIDGHLNCFHFFGNYEVCFYAHLYTSFCVDTARVVLKIK